MIILAYTLSGLSLLMSILLLIRLKVTLPGLILWFPKLLAGALSPYWAVAGVAGAVIGWLAGAIWAVPFGGVGAGVTVWYVRQCVRDHDGFETAFGADWRDRLSHNGSGNMLQSRWTWFLKVDGSPKPSFEQDIVYWTVPGTQRELLCDLWRPGDGNASGLAFIYFHGSGWYIGDKDFGTRGFFQHLAIQGHTVMDVSYRLCPEVDIFGMIGDVKYAIAWMKENAERYGVDPEKIVLAGGSAGAHLALLAGYTPEYSKLTPEDLQQANLFVCGVVSYYGPTDLRAFYQKTGQDRVAQNDMRYFPPVPADPEAPKDVRNAGRLDILLGGHPQEVPDMYRLASINTHIHPDCPPTLLIQGEHDRSVPVSTTRAFYKELVEAEVPAINVVIPMTGHGFDLVLPQLSPAFQTALYDVDRFLALLAN